MNVRNNRQPVAVPGEPEWECWACGSPGQRWCPCHHGPAYSRGLCRPCYQRWQRRGFTGTGPYYLTPRVRDRLEDYGDLIKRLSASQAAERIGVTRRTITRWRAAARQAAA